MERDAFAGSSAGITLPLLMLQMTVLIQMKRGDVQGVQSTSQVGSNCVTPASAFYSKIMLFMQYMFCQAGDRSSKRYRALMQPGSQSSMDLARWAGFVERAHETVRDMEGVGRRLMYQVLLDGLNDGELRRGGRHWLMHNPGIRGMDEITDYLAKCEATFISERRERLLASS